MSPQVPAVPAMAHALVSGSLLSGSHTLSTASLPSAKYSDPMTPRQKRTQMVAQAMGNAVPPAVSSRHAPQPPQPQPSYSMLSTERSSQKAPPHDRTREFNRHQMSQLQVRLLSARPIPPATTRYAMNIGRGT